MGGSSIAGITQPLTNVRGSVRLPQPNHERQRVAIRLKAVRTGIRNRPRARRDASEAPR